MGNAQIYVFFRSGTKGCLLVRNKANTRRSREMWRVFHNESSILSLNLLKTKTCASNNIKNIFLVTRILVESYLVKIVFPFICILSFIYT